MDRKSLLENMKEFKSEYNVEGNCIYCGSKNLKRATKLLRTHMKMAKAFRYIQCGKCKRYMCESTLVHEEI